MNEAFETDDLVFILETYDQLHPDQLAFDDVVRYAIHTENLNIFIGMYEKYTKHRLTPSAVYSALAEANFIGSSEYFKNQLRELLVEMKVPIF